ncbi:MAG: hypothetical protein IPP71_03770 [Bacteroidetes bacterium]|nr:hypothetical protein [Bacteroidota bacterium]
MYILGISAHYHDSAAALLQDGVIIAAIQEERLSRIKHDNAFPLLAANQCMALAGITSDAIDCIVYYEKPFWKFERILDTITNRIPFTYQHFAKAIPLWVKNRLWIGSEIRKTLNFKGKVLYAAHHDSHAAAAYYSSEFKDAAIITLDGVGEHTTTTISCYENNKFELLREQHFPHSLGLLYSAFTQYCGFKVNSGEYKLMGLAPYGKPVYKQLIYDALIELFPDGSYRLNMNYFNYSEGLSMINRNFEKLFGKPQRKPESEIDLFYKDVAASIQAVLEEVTLKIVKIAKALTLKQNVVFAGGVALNCKLNQKIVEEKIFESHYFYPCPGDAGSAVGAAYLGWHQFHQKISPAKRGSEVYLGNALNEYPKVTTTEEALLKNKIPFTKIAGDIEIISEALAAGKIVGWYNGRMEFGPRALGNRSILADPRQSTMKAILNEKIKLRENFRPFAPAVLYEKATELFELGTANYNTMMVTAAAKRGTAELMPAVIHEDGTARIQTVSKTDNRPFYELLQSFYEKTGCPALINTSFNVRGEPIVASLEDAIRTFLYTDMDILVFDGEFMICKSSDLKSVMKTIQPNLYADD